MRTLTRAAVLALALAITGAAALALADDTAVKLQGKGSRRDALNAMSYKPFDASLWGKLEGWTNGPALTKESTAGKPVLIVTWAAWFTTSHSALAEAQNAAGKYKDLSVVAVHHAKGFDRAPALLADKKLSLPVAHDAKGEFFQALQADNAGRFYIIDRAGNLRFADVEKPSLDEALKIVADETPETAAKAEDRFKEAQKSKGDAPMGGPGVKDRVAPEDYKAVKWPAANKGELSAKNLQGKPLPVKLGKEKYLAAAPEREGKIVVLDFWATWCPPCRAAMPKLDELSKKYAKDVVVIGISDEDESKVRAFIKQNKHSYPQAVDPTAAVKSSIGIQGIPHVVVLSTDGVIRWQGNPYPEADLPALQETVAKLIDLDPGVKARRAREKKS